jgi:hypothetical protein
VFLIDVRVGATTEPPWRDGTRDTAAAMIYYFGTETVDNGANLASGRRHVERVFDVQSVLLSLAVLACPVGMGLMMWMMMRGQRRDDPSAVSPVVDVGDDTPQLQELRAEIEQLKADRAARPVTGQR